MDNKEALDVTSLNHVKMSNSFSLYFSQFILPTFVPIYFQKIIHEVSLITVIIWCFWDDYGAEKIYKLLG